MKSFGASLRCLLILWLSTLLPQADVVRLDWDRSPNTNLLFYVIHYGQTQRSSDDPLRYVYSIEVIVPTPTTFLIITNITSGVWYFSATAVLTNGLESLFSNQVTYTNRAFAPVVLRIVGPTEALAVQASNDGGITWLTAGVVTPTNAPLLMTSGPAAMIRTKPLRLPPAPPSVPP